jgi:tripartite-type tricarboxylate transporter receptor subunit TctC
MVRMAALPDVKQKLGTLGFTPVASTSEAYEAQIKSDLETWSKVVKDLGITVQ